MRKLILRLIADSRLETKWRGPVLRRGLAIFLCLSSVLLFPSYGETASLPSSSCAALVTLVDYVERYSRPPQSFPVALQIGQALIRASRKSRLPLYLLVAVAQEESSFNPGAVNAVSQDYGLFQIHYSFWQKFFRKREGENERRVSRKDLMGVEINARMAADILAYDLKLSRGDVVEMLGRYSGRTGAAHARYVQNILRYSFEYKHEEIRRKGACPAS